MSHQKTASRELKNPDLSSKNYIMAKFLLLIEITINALPTNLNALRHGNAFFSIFNP